jgi:hypothetical protein
VFTDSYSGLRDYWFRPGVAHPRRSQWLRVLLIFLLGMLCGAAIASAAEPCVRVKVRPTVMLVKQDIDTQVRVYRHADHRELLISWTYEGEPGGSSTRQLDGDTAAFLHTLWLRDQRPGNYEFTAIVRGAGGRVLGSDHIRILAPSRDDE